MAEPVWFHIDVNSAFLSWTAAYRTLVEGRSPDLRDIPAVIANDKNLRTSIVLAKSTPAKKYGVKTGEPLGMARDKCPNLVVAEPDSIGTVTDAVGKYPVSFLIEAWAECIGEKDQLRNIFHLCTLITVRAVRGKNEVAMFFSE